MTASPIAYLVSRYPAISHTFILREIAGLRDAGFQIRTASINPPDRSREQMEALEKSELDATLYVKAVGVSGALSALKFWLLRDPLALLRMLATSFSLGKGNQWWFGLAYGIEAAIIAQWMNRQSISMLHVHFGTAGATVGVLVKKLTGCHLSYTIHGPDEFDDVPGNHLPLKMDMADEVVCISQFAKGQLMRLSNPANWAKLKVCRLGVDPSQFSSAPHLRKPEDAVSLLCVGRLTPAKGQLLLIEACAKLRDKGLNFKLTMVGDGPDRARIESAIGQLKLGKKVNMTGALNQVAVRQAFSEADIFVLPSLAEGIPVVLMEAIASGVPCVTTPVNGIPELIEHKVGGLLATPGDVDSLTLQLETLIQQPALRSEIAIHALAKLNQDFDLHTNVQKLGTIFSNFKLKGV